MGLPRRIVQLQTASRLRAAGIHFALSIGVAALAAGLVFALWYRTPFREISGGRELFLIVIAVDVVVGPLITFAVFDLRKARTELVRDLTVVGLLQVAALAYGLHTVAQARPVVVALEGDRLRVVRAIDLADTDLTRAPAGLRDLSWVGPRFVSTRQPRNDEKLEAIDRGLQGEDIGMRPDFWLPVDQTRIGLRNAAKPLAALAIRNPARRADLERSATELGLSPGQLGYLPILARRTDWSALVDLRSGEVVGYVDIEGF